MQGRHVRVDEAVAAACRADAFCAFVVAELQATAAALAAAGHDVVGIALGCAPLIVSAARVAGVDDDLADFEAWVCSGAAGRR